MKNFLFWLSRLIDYPLCAPEVLQISLTNRCNLRCRMCTLAGQTGESEELSTHEIFRLAREAADYGVSQILLTGGEPFLREDLFDIISFISSLGLSSVVTTNGTLFEPQWPQRLRKCGLSHLHFSIDGIGPTHDHYRGHGAFDLLARSIRFFSDHKKKNGSFSLGAAVTVMDQNVGELFEIYRLCGEWGLDIINFQPVTADNANFMDEGLPENWIKIEKLGVLRAQIERIKSDQTVPIKLYEEPRLELLEPYYAKKLKRSEWVCFGGFKTAFVCFSKKEPLLYSCHGICGNLKDLPLKRAWKTPQARSLRRHSRFCDRLCLQSCYSLQEAGSFAAVFAGAFHRSMARKERAR